MRRSSGKKLMIRSSAWLALLACSVARHRWPVSANATACSMVSRSRISPIRITSGACRRLFLSAMLQPSVSSPTSRWVTMQFLCACTNSTGSSTVMMWPKEFSLRQSTMAASVVVLPQPVAPTRITSPRLVMATSLRISGNFSSSMVGIFCGITRNTIPTLPICMKVLTRKRPIPGGATAKLHSLVASNSDICRSFMIERTSANVCAAERGCADTLLTLPSTLMAGGKSAVINRSLPLRLTMSLSSSCMNWLAWSRFMVFPPIRSNR